MSYKWNDVENKMPDTDKFGDSENLLCLEEDNVEPFVAFYNRKKRAWMVSHHSSNLYKVVVVKWKKI